MNYTKVNEFLLDTHPGQQLPPANPASSEVAQKLPNNCPTVVGKLPLAPNIGPNSAEIDRVGPRFDRVGPTLTNIPPSLADVGTTFGDPIGRNGVSGGPLAPK